MKAVPLAIRGALLGLLATSLPAQDPVLGTPGTATWSKQDIGTGTRTAFSLTGNTVLNWDHLHLESGSEMDFNFVKGADGNSVLNILSSGKTHYINGSVTSNGHVGFVSPNASLVVEGDITAQSVTLSTQNIDPVEFAGGKVDKSFAAGGRNSLIVRGNIDATKGDALFVAANIEISPTGTVRAKGGSILYAAGMDGVEVSKNGMHRLEAKGKGAVTHLGDTNAARIEIAAGNEVTNGGIIGNSKGNGNGRIWIEVGPNGRISNEGSGIMLGVTSTSGIPIGTGIILGPDTGDELLIKAEASLEIPKVRRPNREVVTEARTVSSTTSMSARSDAVRQAKAPSGGRTVAKVNRSKSMLTRGSFLGVRGGSGKVASR